MREQVLLRAKRNIMKRKRKTNCVLNYYSCEIITRTYLRSIGLFALVQCNFNEILSVGVYRPVAFAISLMAVGAIAHLCPRIIHHLFASHFIIIIILFFFLFFFFISLPLQLTTKYSIASYRTLS